MKQFIFWACVASCLCSFPSLAFENAIGLEYGQSSAQGDVCDAFPSDSGCISDDENARLFYGARFNEQWELRATLTFMDIRFTDSVDPIFNDPSVSSEILDLAAVYHWRLNDSVSIQGKAGLGFWNEEQSGPGFIFSGESDDGVTPVLGAQAEFGSSAIRFALSIDIYPSVGDTDSVSFIGAGLRIVW